MTVALKGSSATALTAGILLLSRSRMFGQPLDVEIVGDPDEITPVLGPAAVHAPVLASCGVGRELGHGALVIVPGPAADPLAVSISEDGTGDWFYVDRSGDGLYPASRAFVELCRTREAAARHLGRELRDAMAALGCPPEPALIELMCASDAPPLMRLSLALRAGQAMSGAGRQPLMHWLTAGSGILPDPLPSPLDRAELDRARADGRLGALLDRVRLRDRDRLADWLGAMLDGPDHRYDPLVCCLVEVLGHFASLPAGGMMPPLAPAPDAVAVGLGAALGAGQGQADANRSLTEMFRFLGGRFTDDARYPVELSSPPPPSERLARWQWFCRATRQAADTADALWRRVIDPVQ